MPSRSINRRQVHFSPTHPRVKHTPRKKQMSFPLGKRWREAVEREERERIMRCEEERARQRRQEEHESCQDDAPTRDNSIASVDLDEDDQASLLEEQFTKSYEELEAEVKSLSRQLDNRNAEIWILRDDLSKAQDEASCATAQHLVDEVDIHRLRSKLSASNSRLHEVQDFMERFIERMERNADLIQEQASILRMFLEIDQ